MMFHKGDLVLSRSGYYGVVISCDVEIWDDINENVYMILWNFHDGGGGVALQHRFERSLRLVA